MSIVLIWCACLAIYLVFAGEINSHEVMTGLVLATLATAWARIIRRTSQRYFIFSRQPIEPLIRGLMSLLPASLAAGGALLRVAVVGGPAGGPQFQRFDYGSPAEFAYGPLALLSRYKIATGVVVVGLITALAWNLRRISPPTFRWLRRLAGELSRGGMSLLPEIMTCAAALLRAHEARRLARLERTQAHSADRTRRALAVLLASLAPDRFIVNVDRQSHVVLMHVIVPNERELDPQWLI